MTTPASASAPRASAPPTRTVTSMMALVLIALLPAGVALCLASGPALAGRMLLAGALALAVEWLALRLRGRAPHRFVRDLSAPVTAVLLLLSLPLDAPVLLLAAAVCAAIGSKHVYGGLGDNPFNPAMFGYALLVLLWPAAFADGAPPPVWLAPLYGVGGLLLLFTRTIGWQAPLAMLAGAATMIALGSVSGAASSATWSQLLPATWVLAAFFIVTDPVTGCLSPSGRFIFGAGAGVLTVVFDRAGLVSGHGLPFAVLTMNALAPWLDRYTRPGRLQP